MKVFLTALAVIDDLIAIIVIAIFYAANLNLFYLFAAVVVTGLLIYCNRSGCYNGRRNLGDDNS